MLVVGPLTRDAHEAAQLVAPATVAAPDSVSVVLPRSLLPAILAAADRESGVQGRSVTVDDLVAMAIEEFCG